MNRRCTGACVASLVLWLEVEAVDGSGKAICYGMTVANGSTGQDPTAFEIRDADSRLAESVPPGITGVTAGAGLSGGGSGYFLQKPKSSS
jgi:hypothetical protein